MQLWSLALLGMTLIIYDIGLCLCGELDSMEWKSTYLCDSQHMIILFCIHACSGKNQKRFEHFGRILVVKIWQPTRLLKINMLILDKPQLNHHPLQLQWYYKKNDVSSRKSYSWTAWVTEWSRKLSETFSNVSEKFFQQCFGKIRSIINLKTVNCSKTI